MTFGSWFARLMLALLAGYGVARILDPEARWGTALVRGDRIEHALLVYGLVTALLAAFQRLPLWGAASLMLAAGVGVEVLQALPGVPGAFQVGDLLADVVGIVLATIPFLVGSAREGKRKS